MQTTTAAPARSHLTRAAAAKTWATARGIAGRAGGYLHAANFTAYDALPYALKALHRGSGTRAENDAARTFRLWDYNATLNGGRSIQGWDSLGAVLFRIGEITVDNTGNRVRYAPKPLPVAEEPAAPAPVEVTAEGVEIVDGGKAIYVGPSGATVAGGWIATGAEVELDLRLPCAAPSVIVRAAGVKGAAAVSRLHLRPVPPIDETDPEEHMTMEIVDDKPGARAYCGRCQQYGLHVSCEAVEWRMPADDPSGVSAAVPGPEAGDAARLYADDGREAAFTARVEAAMDAAVGPPVRTSHEIAADLVHAYTVAGPDEHSRSHIAGLLREMVDCAVRTLGEHFPNPLELYRDGLMEGLQPGKPEHPVLSAEIREDLLSECQRRRSVQIGAEVAARIAGGARPDMTFTFRGGER